MGVVLTNDPTQFALGLAAVVVGAEPPGESAGLSVGDGDDVGLPRIPDNIVGMKAVIAYIEMPVWANERRRVDMQPITNVPTRQFSKIGVTEQNGLCGVIKAQFVEMLMGAP